MCHITIPKPTVRSMRPAIIGTIAASARSAMIALSLRIDRALMAVGNDSGSSSENTAMSRTVRIGRPYTGSTRTNARPRLSAANSERVGSRALDLRDCIVGPGPGDPGRRGGEEIFSAQVVA